MKHSHLIAMRLMAVLVLSALVLVAPLAAHAAPSGAGTPPIPNYYTGLLQIGVNAPAPGSVILASVPGQTPAPFQGSIGQDTNGHLSYSIVVPGDIGGTTDKEGGRTGDPVTFTINGRTVAVASGDNGWVSGGLDNGKTTFDIILPVDHITLTPKQALVAYGGSQAFTTEAFAAQGWSMGDATADTTFGIDTLAGGTWGPAGVYQSANPGDWTVTAGLLTKTDTAALHVASPNVPPVHPSSFFGIINTGDGSVQDGNSLEVTVPGVAAPFTAIVQNDPTYGLAFQIDVPGDDDTTTAVKEGGIENDLLTFRVAGRTFATAQWHGATNMDLNLHPPKAALTAPAATEGVAVIIDARTTTDAGSDMATYTFDCGGGVYVAGATGTAQCTFPQQGSYTVGVAVVDQQGGTGAATLPVQVANVTPVVSLGDPAPVTVSAGDTFSRAGSFADPGADTWSATVNYGDGGGDQSQALNANKTFNVSHVYAAAGTYTLRVTVSDGTGSGSATLTVTAVIPQAEAGGPYTGTAGQAIALHGTSTCPTGHTCTVAWLYNGTVIGNAADAAYTWYAAGSYTVDFQVTDTTAHVTATDSAAVTINPASATIHLVPGWNLVSFDIVPKPSTAPDAILAGIAGRYDLVYAWDGASQSWRKADNVPVSPDDLTALDQSKGFWIEITGSTPVDLVVQGDVPTSTTIALFKLKTGWNLVGYPSAHDTTLSPASIPALKLVYAFDRSRTPDPWRIYDPNALPFANTLKALTRNWGYWLQVTQDGTWTVTQ